MFALRRLHSRSLQRTLRGNATLSVSSPPPSESAPPPSTVSTDAHAPTQTQGRKLKRATGTKPKRSNISLSNPKEWNKPLPQGVIPAYDLALQFLQRDSHALKAEVRQLRAAVREKEASREVLLARLGDAQGDERVKLESELEVLEGELEGMLKKVDIVEVQSEINLPDVRWKASNAMADMSKTSHRYLVEQKWRKDGDLDLLMERLHQMHVVPDMLPSIKPSIDLHIAARTKPTEFLQTGKVKQIVEPGVFLRPKQTIVPPHLYATVFHTDVRLYTMLLVDLDVPHPESATYTTFLHWMKPNIPLSATSPAHIPNLNTHTTYIPPHPQRGTPYHRYALVLLPQPPLPSLGRAGYTLAAASRAGVEPTSEHLDIPVVSGAERRGFDVRAFAEYWGLDAAMGGGAHMWRAVWDEDVSGIYRDILHEDEPRYGQPPKFDAYAEMKERKKYAL